MEVHAHNGAKAIAIALGRSVRSVECQASKFGISLKRRWYCPRCNCFTFTPLSIRTGWCRVCTVEHSKERTAIRNREARQQLEKERRRLESLEKERQALYSDTERRRKEINRLRNDGKEEE